MASLERAIALADGDDAARPVAEELDLDVSRRTDLSLEVDGPVAERGGGLGGRRGQGRGQVGKPLDPPHPPASTAGRGLDDQRNADPLGLREGRGDRIRTLDADRVEGAGDGLDTGRMRESSSGELVADGLDGVSGRPDEDEADIGHGPREGGTLGEEAVAGVDGVAAGRQGRVDDAVDAEIALGRRCRPDPHRAVGHPDVERVDVGIAVHRDRRHPSLVTGPDDPDGDLAAVGDEHPPEWRSVFVQRRRFAGPRVRAGCCHASFEGSSPVCPGASPASGSIAVWSPMAG